MEKIKKTSKEADSRPNSNPLISSKGLAILGLVVSLGVLSTIYNNDNEPEEARQLPGNENLVEPSPKVSENTDFLSSETEDLDKKRNWKLHFARVLKALKEAEKNGEHNLTAKSIIDPQAYMHYVEMLIEDHRSNYPVKAKQLEYAMGFLLDPEVGFLDTNKIAIADWKNITQMIDDFDENDFGQSAQQLNEYFIKMSITFGARSRIIDALEQGMISNDEATSLLLLTEDIDDRDEVESIVMQELNVSLGQATD